MQVYVTGEALFDDMLAAIAQELSGAKYALITFDSRGRLTMPLTDDAAALAAQARGDGVSILTTVVAAMTAVTRDLADSPLRAVFPVHSRYDARWHDSVGWFIANSVLESSDPDPQACAAAVREAVHLGSWPLDDVMRPWGGMPEAPGMFAVSWLDLRRLRDAGRLAEAILKDVALTHKLLRLVNTAAYRHTGGGGISTVSPDAAAAGAGDDIYQLNRKYWDERRPHRAVADLLFGTV